jgi:Tol biopolymer transport system component
MVRAARPIPEWLSAFRWSAAVVATAGIARAQSIEEISVADSGSEGGARSYSPDVSDDGLRIAFTSDAHDLVQNDTNYAADVFVRRRDLGTTIRVSVSSSGVQADRGSREPRISGDGSNLVFTSDADNLIPTDLNGVSDVFLRDLNASTTTRMSVNNAGTKGGNRASFSPAISSDGRYVVFASDATDLVTGDSNGVTDVFVRDRKAKTTIRVSVATNGTEANGASTEPDISRDGRYVTFTSTATNLDPNDSDSTVDVYLHDMTTGTTTLVSVNSNGTKGNNASYVSSVSDDGTRVLFQSTASNFVSGDLGWSPDAFVRDLSAGTTTCIDVDSNGTIGGIPSLAYSDLSGDGRFAFFNSESPSLVEDDVNFASDVFAHETPSGVTIRSSVAWDGTESNGDSTTLRTSIDGRHVVFSSTASNLLTAPTNGVEQVYLRERRIDDASDLGYGVGHSGTLGVPSLTASAAPVMSRSVDLLFDNSWGRWTVGLLILGNQRAQLPTAWGGDLLVDPASELLLPIPPTGGVYSDDVPVDELIVGDVFDAQVLEIDPGASAGISFTNGLELVVGY